MSKLIVLRGNSGSGKSSAAKALQRELGRNTLMIAQDTVFEAAAALFGKQIYAYYYDLPFEETLRRHATKKNRFSFGEKEMRRWWRDRDHIGLIPEKSIGVEVSLDEAVHMILSDMQAGK